MSVGARWQLSRDTTNMASSEYWDEVGTLCVVDKSEPGYQEYRPDQVDYWSSDASIAPQYFPYNRSTVWQCLRCSRLYLRYTEGGGYFVDRRIRAVRSSLIRDIRL